MNREQVREAVLWIKENDMRSYVHIVEMCSMPVSQYCMKWA